MPSVVPRRLTVDDPLPIRIRDCSSAAMRERVRDVMRYAGPRMLRPHPILSLGDILDKLRPAPKLKERAQSDRKRR